MWLLLSAKILNASSADAAAPEYIRKHAMMTPVLPSRLAVDCCDMRRAAVKPTFQRLAIAHRTLRGGA